MSWIPKPGSSLKSSPSSEGISPIKGQKRTFEQITQEENVPIDTGTDSNVHRSTTKRRKMEKGSQEEKKITTTLDIAKWSFDPTKKRNAHVEFPFRAVDDIKKKIDKNKASAEKAE